MSKSSVDKILKLSNKEKCIVLQALRIYSNITEPQLNLLPFFDIRTVLHSVNQLKHETEKLLAVGNKPPIYLYNQHGIVEKIPRLELISKTLSKLKVYNLESGKIYLDHRKIAAWSKRPNSFAFHSSNIRIIKVEIDIYFFQLISGKKPEYLKEGYLTKLPKSNLFLIQTIKENYHELCKILFMNFGAF